jgi:phosphohistidine phosphatase
MAEATTTELYLLRHAHAGDPAAWDGPDAARPLSKKGRRQTERLARFLAGVGFRPDVIVSSPKVRARETADGVADALDLQVDLDDRLASGFAIGDLEALFHDVGDPTRVVLVGHDPDFSMLLADLTGIDGVYLRKGALARIDVARPAAMASGTLSWLVPPDVLDPG